MKDSLDGSNSVAVAPPAGGGDSGPVSLTAEQMAKLRSDLDILQTNMTVFGEMINEMSPGNEHPSDLELFQVYIFLVILIYIPLTQFFVLFLK